MLILDMPSQLKPLKPPHVVCTVGVFDGVHLGHKKIMETISQSAKECGGTTVVITFDKHPFNVLNPSMHLPLLTSPPHKLMLLAETGIDICIMINFNHEIASIPAETWIKESLWNEMHIERIYLGEDSFFGKDGKGDLTLLSQYGKKLGFKAIKLDMLKIEQTPISSTIIRNLVSLGNLSAAQKLLGRHYSVFGTHVRGMGLGKKIGFPTINLETQNQCMPPNGIYAVLARPAPAITEGKIDASVSGQRGTFQAVANLGIRPTFNMSGNKPVLEAHLLLDKPIPPLETIEVIFIKKIREELTFPGIKELAAQIEKDISRVKKIFSSL